MPSTEKHDNLIEQEILNTFFAKTRKEPLTHPADKPKAPVRSNFRNILVVLILSLCLAISAVIIILYIKRSPSPDPGVSGYKQEISLNLIKNGVINRKYVDEIFFDGDARSGSSFTDRNTTLINKGSYGRASLVMRFHAPLDIINKNILINARSLYGQKNIRVILMDTENRFQEYGDIRLTSNWSLKHIFIQQERKFDTGSIVMLKIEFGTHTAGNEQDSVIYLQSLDIRGAM